MTTSHQYARGISQLRDALQFNGITADDTDAAVIDFARVIYLDGLAKMDEYRRACDWDIVAMTAADLERLQRAFELAGLRIVDAAQYREISSETSSNANTALTEPMC